MSTRYPFRFYGREPANWTPSPHGYLYDLQFAAEIDGAERAELRALAERHFARGAAGLGDIWRWGAGKYLVFAVTERMPDAARMVFTQVAEFLSHVGQVARLRDAVFCNGLGSRADRWDAWSLAQSPEADPGPARPDEPWAELLRRPESPTLAWDAPEPPAEGAPGTAAPEAGPSGKKARPKPALTPVTELPSQENPRLDARNAELEKHVKGAPARPTFTRPKGVAIPLVFEGTNVLRCFDGKDRCHRIELPGHVEGAAVAVDPDGLHAAIWIGNTAYSVDLHSGQVLAQHTIHRNSVGITGIAWSTGDLWVVRMHTQVQLFDFTRTPWGYVAFTQPSGALVGTVHQGTVLVFTDGQHVTLLGLCDWQLHKLGAVPAESAVIVQDELYVTARKALHRVDGLHETYEAWAVPLRRAAEKNRLARMKPVGKRALVHPRWAARAPSEVPKSETDTRHAELCTRFTGFLVGAYEARGASVIACGDDGKHWSASAKFLVVEGADKPTSIPCEVAAGQGLTTFGASPTRNTLMLITGGAFTLHAVDVATGETSPCKASTFPRPGKPLFSLTMPHDTECFILWSDALEVYHLVRDAWVRREVIPVREPRAIRYDHGRGLLTVEGQGRVRVRLFQWSLGALEPVASLTDAVKETSWRGGRLFAQMIDGLWFELLGLPSAEA